MTTKEAIEFIRPGISSLSGTWADIGAGTGLFTIALSEILQEGKILAIDKSPHGLYQSKIDEKSPIPVEIVEADFHLSMGLPQLDGILMANALHYAKDHLVVLNNILPFLKKDGTFLLIEYDTEKANPPWVPNPVSLNKFRALCAKVGLEEPKEIGRRKSIYQDGEIYGVVTKWKGHSKLHFKKSYLLPAQIH